MALSPDATLADVSTLDQPEEYVRCVLGNMHACKKEQDGDVAVTIGITGEGKVPFYRVDFVTEIEINNGAFNMNVLSRCTMAVAIREWMRSRALLCRVSTGASAA